MKMRFDPVHFIRVRTCTHAGENALALDWLEKGDPWSALIKVDVDWDGLRDEPRFRELLKKMELVN